MGIECLNMRAFAYLREIFDSKHTKPILSTFSLSLSHTLRLAYTHSLFPRIFLNFLNYIVLCTMCFILDDFRCGE